ncbi:hypothetical protein [Modestobacter marinus]|jgi:hypothetical protein|uniref:hypothetical protein n=1 Tax=Modestobacter marinus TaxID=477641 RepID=UPI001C9608EB|nr:hypothetical protein [Modestobacter marinus]
MVKAISTSFGAPPLNETVVTRQLLEELVVQQRETNRLLAELVKANRDKDA